MSKLVLHGRAGRTLEVDLRSPRVLAVTVMVCVFLVGGVFAAGSVLGAYWAEAKPGQQMQRWSLDLDRQRQEVEAARRLLESTVDALAVRVGDINAHVVRLDALGKRLTQLSGIRSPEFDFDRRPPNLSASVSANAQAGVPGLTDLLDSLSNEIADRERQMGALEHLVLASQERQAVVPQGPPVSTGFISSSFGSRLDPFTGYTAFHPGVDFAGTAGEAVSTVASGIVLWAGPKVGYGSLVEIDHGNGFVTRYAHNARVLVQVGDTVQKGQAVALMGSTGHSTGPHVHFEVLRDGVPVDPMGFIQHGALPTLASRR
jgi:murein DD-endopeptidase MepM/ murein hydrolase activator NlpD